MRVSVCLWGGVQRQVPNSPRDSSLGAEVAGAARPSAGGVSATAGLGKPTDGR